MIRIEVIRAWPRRHACALVELADGATVSEAVAAAGFAGSDIAAYAIHGERVDAAYALHDGDRLELLRALVIDPKEARRKRANADKG